MSPPPAGVDGSVTGGVDACVDCAGSGPVTPDPPGFPPVPDAEDCGPLLVPGWRAVPSTTPDPPEAGASPPGSVAVPVPAEGLVCGAVPPVPEGCAGCEGSGVVSTCPAGAPSSWPGTGIQGASELPESSVETMTTA